MSRDHDWGLRRQVAVAAPHVGEVQRALRDRLPREFAGHPTWCCFTGEAEPRVGIDVVTVEELLAEGIGFDPRLKTTTEDWLSLTGQAALELTAGEVFEDAAGELTAVRQALTSYPEDVWRYLVATDWQRLDQELPLMGRAGDRRDDLGSRVITARLVDTAVADSPSERTTRTDGCPPCVVTPRWACPATETGYFARLGVRPADCPKWSERRCAEEGASRQPRIAPPISMPSAEPPASVIWSAAKAARRFSVRLPSSEGRDARPLRDRDVDATGRVRAS